MSRPVKTKRDHYLWQEIIAARPDIGAAFKVVAWRLALHRNLKTGRCDPSYSELASGSANCERTAKRAIAEFIRLGLIELERSGGGAPTMTNKYRLLIPAEGVSSVTPLGASAGVSGHVDRGDRKSPRGVWPVQGGVTELCPTNSEENNGRKIRTFLCRGFNWR